MPKAKDLIPRVANVWDRKEIAARMMAALRAAERPVPRYLTRVGGGTATIERATSAMHCFWSGEAGLGAVDGVVETRAAGLGSREVVEVSYDPVGGRAAQSRQGRPCNPPGASLAFRVS